MSWFVPLAIFAFFFWVARRADNRTREIEPSGILRSPLYWTSHALVMLLIGLALYMAHYRTTSALLWFAVVAIIVALLFIRRALKWRYPI